MRGKRLSHTKSVIKSEAAAINVKRGKEMKGLMKVVREITFQLGMFVAITIWLLAIMSITFIVMIFIF